MQMLPIKFEYRGTGYEALIRIKTKGTKREYCITVMNGDLERMLFGHHKIIEENGCLQTGTAPDEETAHLKTTIVAALEAYLRRASLVPEI